MRIAGQPASDLKSAALVVQGAMAVGLKGVAYSRLYEKRVALVSRTGFSTFTLHVGTMTVVKSATECPDSGHLNSVHSENHE